ncbi:MAG: hypothetical protein EOM19_02190 [Candidatus Moranbacteria bacterium]|nr:hypothetical protein [Candidatus Moranbacteria bacterium]
MGMHTHLSLLKEYGETKSIYVQDYGFITTRLYQEFLLEEKLEYVNLDKIPETAWESGLSLQTLYVDENNYADGTIEVEDLIKLLKKCEELHDPESDDEWLSTNWRPLIKKLEAMTNSKIISKNDTIEFKYW